MLVEITKESLMNALQHVIKAVAVNSPLPVLQGINIEVGIEDVRFTASNTSMTIQFKIPSDGASVTIMRAGAIVIPSRYFYEVVRKLNDEMVVLEVREQMILLITSGHSNIRLCGMDPADFPQMVTGEDHSKGKLQLNNALFKSTIKQVAVVASTSETRPILTGVSFKYQNDCLNLIATDGVRLASRNLHIERKGYTNFNFNSIVPARNLYEVSKMVTDTDEVIEIEVSEKRVRFTTNRLRVESALIEGTFPSIKNVIPQSYLSEIFVDKVCLLRAVECVTVIASESIISLVATADTLKLLSRTSEIGDIENEVPFLEMSGEEFKISLNGKLFIDILRSCDCSKFRLRYAGKTKPIVVLPDESPVSTLFLITPVRTHD